MRNRLARGMGLSALILSMLLAACAPASVLRNVSIGQTSISPNGDGIEDEAVIDYTLQQRSTVSITLADAVGKEYSFRRDEERSPGSYSARFNGTYSPDASSAERRVMPDGDYEVRLQVVPRDSQGKLAQGVEQWSGRLSVRGGDTNPPVVSDVVSTYASISPDGDAKEDETDISYALSKASTVTIVAVDAAGTSYLLSPPTERSAALYSHIWNGTSSDNLLPDGSYTIHVQAQDVAGNLSEATTNISVKGGGIPKLEITRVRFSPTTVIKGGDLNVEIRVRNAGKVPLETIGPDPGTPYETGMNFNAFIGDDGQPKYFERAGVWRVGVEWGLAGRPYPVRWGLTRTDPVAGKPPALQPGQEAIITGTIKVNIDQTRENYFWVSVVQEGVGFPGGRVGQQKIVVSF